MCITCRACSPVRDKGRTFEAVKATRELLLEGGEMGTTLEGFECLDCQVNTSEIGEYYMVWDEVWYQAVPDGKGMLCFSCLETRIGRSLTIQDFTGAPINFLMATTKDFITRL